MEEITPEDEINNNFSEFNPDYFGDEEFQLTRDRTSLGTNPSLPIITSLTNSKTISSDDAKLREIWTIKEESLTDDEKIRAIRLLDRNRNAFSQNDYDLGVFAPWKHDINTGEHPPLKCKFRLLSRPKLESLKTELEQLQKAGIIRPSRSDWASPIVMVPKKDHTWRLCVDYRRLNAIATCCQFPLPRIDSILRGLQGASHFTALDLMKGFHQIAMSEEAIQKTAFVTPVGQFEYVKLPFGLHSAPAAFQSAMQHVLGGLENIAMVYVDDVIIHSTSFEQHLQNLQLVLQRLEQFNMKIKKDKCDFFRTELLYLGHKVNAQGIQTDPAKVSAVFDMSEPKCVLEIESFLGKVGYYQKFIQNYSELAVPLFRMKRKDAEFRFKEQERKSFLDLKKALCEAPVLRHPNFELPFSICTDASGYGLGAVLSQTYADGDHPIAYASRTLKEQELRYSATEREALGIWWAIDHFIDYVEGVHFTVFTDHKPLLSLGQKAMNNRRLELIAHKLSEFQFTIIYRKGSENTNADVLSRYPFIPCRKKRSCETQTNASLSNDYDENNDFSTTVPKFKTRKNVQVQTIRLVLNQPNQQAAAANLADLPRLQKQIPFFQALIQYLLTDNWPAKGTFQYEVVRHADLFYLEDDETLIRIAPDGHSMKCLPPMLYKIAFYDGHICVTGGHFGIAKTIHKIQEAFWWPNMTKTIGEYIKECPLCLSHKAPPINPKENMGMRPLTERPWQRIHMDVWSPGGISSSGINHVVAFIDSFTKYVIAVPIKDHKAETIFDIFLTHVVLVYGMPEVFFSDGAPEFTGNLQAELCKVFGVTRRITTPYRPQANGIIERVFRTLRPVMAMFATQNTRQWDEYLPYVIWAYNSSYHASIQDTPFHLMFGRDSTLPLPQDAHCAETSNAQRLLKWKEALTATTKALLKEQERTKKFHDNILHPQQIQLGDCVLIRVSKPPRDVVYKLNPKFVGPFRVVGIKNSVLFVRPLYANQPDSVPKRTHKDLARKCPGDYPPIHTLAELNQPFEDPSHDPLNPPSGRLETESQEKR